MGRWSLAVDVGTAYTAGAIWSERGIEVVEFDHLRVMPSVVCRDDDGRLITGRAAVARAAVSPGQAERVPKRAIAETDRVRLGGMDIPVTDLVAALLAAVTRAAAHGRTSSVPDRLVLTHPARWGTRELGLLAQAAAAADLPSPVFVPEPVAVAWHYLADGGRGPLSSVAVFDLGGGTLDTAVLRRTSDGFALAGPPGGKPDFGGEDLDEVFREVLGRHACQLDAEAWQAIWATDGLAGAQRRARWLEAVRTGREELSAAPTTTVFQDGFESGIRVTRAEYEAAAEPLLRAAVRELADTVARAGIGAPDAVHLAGGTSRTPMVSDLITAAFDLLPTTTADPKTSTVLGSLYATDSADHAHRAALNPPTTPPLLPPPPPSPTAESPQPPLRHPARKRNATLVTVVAGMVAVLVVGVGAAIAVPNLLTDATAPPPTTHSDINPATDSPASHAATARTETTTSAGPSDRTPTQTPPRDIRPSQPTSPPPASTSASSSVVPAPYVGTWQGTVSYPGGQPDSLTLTISPGSIGSPVGSSHDHYCSGTEYLEDTHEGLHLREDITDNGAHVCGTTAEVALAITITGDLAWSYTSMTTTNGPIPTSRLGHAILTRIS